MFRHHRHLLADERRSIFGDFRLGIGVGTDEIPAIAQIDLAFEFQPARMHLARCLWPIDIAVGNDIRFHDVEPRQREQRVDFLWLIFYADFPLTAFRRIESIAAVIRAEIGHEGFRIADIGRDTPWRHIGDTRAPAEFPDVLICITGIETIMAVEVQPVIAPAQSDDPVVVELDLILRIKPGLVVFLAIALRYRGRNRNRNTIRRIERVQRRGRITILRHIGIRIGVIKAEQSLMRNIAGFKF